MLVTKLDKKIESTKLHRLGHIQLEVNADANFYLQLGNTSNFTATIIGDGKLFTNDSYTTEYGKTHTYEGAAYPTRHIIALSAGHYVLDLDNKYTYGWVSMPSNYISANLYDFGFSTSIKTFNVKDANVVGDISYMKKIEMVNFTFMGTPITGNVNELVEYQVENGRVGSFSITTNKIVVVNGTDNVERGITVNIVSDTEYTLTYKTTTLTYKKIGGKWVLQ